MSHTLISVMATNCKKVPFFVLSDEKTKEWFRWKLMTIVIPVETKLAGTAANLRTFAIKKKSTKSSAVLNSPTARNLEKCTRVAKKDFIFSNIRRNSNKKACEREW